MEAFRPDKLPITLSVLGHALLILAVAWLGTGATGGGAGVVTVSLVAGGPAHAERSDSAPTLKPLSARTVYSDDAPAVNKSEKKAPDMSRLERPDVPVSGGAGEGGSAGATGEQASLTVMLIRQAIQGSVQYPPVARRRGYEGTVVASFGVDSDGMPTDVVLVSSSGYNMLDREVLRVIMDSSPYPPLERTVEVPVRFSLVNARGKVDR